jgi:hypothetical protein
LIQYFLTDIKKSIKSTIEKHFREEGSSRTQELDKYRSIDHKIKHISFAFDNNEVLNLLTKRGSALKNADFAQAIVHEEEINKLYLDQKLKDKMTRPTKAFIIFEEARSAELMSKIIKQIDLEDTKTTVGVKKACNPDMMIWETISKRDETKWRKKTCRWIS